MKVELLVQLLMNCIDYHHYNHLDFPHINLHEINFLVHCQWLHEKNVFGVQFLYQNYDHFCKTGEECDWDRGDCCNKITITFEN